jgi:hypothetical protein
MKGLQLYQCLQNLLCGALPLAPFGAGMSLLLTRQ